VSTQTPSVCDKSSTESPDATLASGLLSSFMARNGGRRAAGTLSCPWSLRAAEYQRVSLSIIEFPDPGASAAAAAGATGNDVASFPSCVVVVERAGTGNRSSESMFCGGGRRRENLVYTSTSNAVDIFVTNMTSSREFLIKYEGNEKSAPRDASTARKSYKSRRQKFSPRRRPLPGGARRPKFNQLEMVTTFTYRPSLVKIDARNFELSW